MRLGRAEPEFALSLRFPFKYCLRLPQQYTVLEIINWDSDYLSRKWNINVSGKS